MVQRAWRSPLAEGDIVSATAFPPGKGIAIPPQFGAKNSNAHPIVIPVAIANPSGDSNGSVSAS